MMTLPIIKLKYAWLTVSGLLVAASVVVLLTWGLNLGIDFTGGSLVQVTFQPERPEKAVVTQTLEALGYGGLQIQPSQDNDYIIRTRFLTGEEYQALAVALRELAQQQEGGQLIEQRFEIVGPVIGAELKQKAWEAIVAVLVAIILYIAWAFRSVSKPVQSWKYGLTAIAALFHDIMIPVGIFVLLGHYAAVEVDILFVTALLAILGYSVNDTIIVFDRVRENLLRSREKEFEEIVNISVNQTLGRSINTSVTLLVVLLAIYFYGGVSIQYFILTLIIGVIAGTYSSIFVASPLLALWHNRGKRS